MSSLLPALETAFPDSRERARSFAGWDTARALGAASPAYEMLPIQPLLSIPIDALLSALRREDASEAELEGAARLLGSWSFGKARAPDLKLLTTTDRQRLLARALRSPDLGRQARARKAFAPTR